MSKVNTLHLSNISMEDAGEYICVAENSHAGQAVQAMQSAWLDVLPGKRLLLSASPDFSDFRINVFLPHTNLPILSSTGIIISQTEKLTTQEIPPGTLYLSLKKVLGNDIFKGRQRHRVAERVYLSHL